MQRWYLSRALKSVKTRAMGVCRGDIPGRWRSSSRALGGKSDGEGGVRNRVWKSRMRGRVEVGVLWAPKQPLGEEGSVGEYGSGKHRGLLRLHRDGLGAVWGQDREARKCPGWGLEGGEGVAIARIGPVIKWWWSVQDLDVLERTTEVFWCGRCGMWDGERSPPAGSHRTEYGDGEWPLPERGKLWVEVV